MGDASAPWRSPPPACRAAPRSSAAGCPAAESAADCTPGVSEPRNPKTCGGGAGTPVHAHFGSALWVTAGPHFGSLRVHTLGPDRRRLKFNSLPGRYPERDDSPPRGGPAEFTWQGGVMSGRDDSPPRGGNSPPGEGNSHLLVRVAAVLPPRTARLPEGGKGVGAGVPHLHQLPVRLRLNQPVHVAVTWGGQE
eukprot:179444-Prorocentrum_minimum.AAC.1